ncbi:MAG: nicotinate-nucleotide--dimethylbenzimidazole phosphoribosyltransferase, partial [Hafnia sp.]
MNTLDSIIQRIRPLDRQKMAQAAEYVDALAKPPGSLGRLEQLAIQLSGMSGMANLSNLNKEIIV